MSKSSKYTLPAEWQTDTAILIAWPHPDTDWNYLLADAQQCFEDIIRAITSRRMVILIAPDQYLPRKRFADISPQRLIMASIETNDTWARDFGVITLSDASGVFLPLDFQFNGWGLKFAACRDNLVTHNMWLKNLITIQPVNCRNFVLEGGGVESDGQGTLMTTAQCQLSPNRNAWLTESQIKNKLKQYFGATNLIWIEHGYLEGDDTDSHIDTLARFAPDNTIIYVGCDDPSDPHFRELQAMEMELKNARNANGEPYNLVRLPWPKAIYDENNLRLPATYANFLITPDAVYMPTYRQPISDQLAAKILQTVFTTPVISVDCSALIRQHGSLHCVTMQIPRPILAI